MMNILFDPAENEQTAGDPAASDATFDRGALEAKLEGKMSDVFAEADPIEDEAGDPPVDEADETTNAAKPEDEAGGEDNKDEKNEAAAEGSDDPDAPTLPDAYRRSLKAYGWEDAEIDTNLKALGGKFIETAARLHANRNEEVQQWAAIGRQVKSGSQPNQQQVSQQPATSNLPQQFAPIDVKKLADVYGDEALVKEVVTPVNGMIAAMNAVLPLLHATLSQQTQSQDAEVVTTVNGFFGDEKLVKGYGQLYGDGVNAMTETQRANRNAVLDNAEALMLGAQQQGRKLSVKDALSLAHDLVSAPFREQAAKASITKEAKTRNKGLSQRPTGKGSKPSLSSKPRNRVELESKISGLLVGLR